MRAKLVSMMVFITLVLQAPDIAAQLEFSLPRPINTDASADITTDIEPSVAADTDGNVVVVWLRPVIDALPDPVNRVFYAYSSDFGESWSPPNPISLGAPTPIEGPERDAMILTDGLGNWVTIWSRTEYSSSPAAGSKSSEGSVAPKSHYDDHDTDIFAAYSIDNGQTWSSPQILSDPAITERFYEYEPVLAVSGEIWIAAWATEETPEGEQDINMEILFVRSTDGGKTWSSPALMIPGGLGHFDYIWDIGLGGDGSGAFVAAWDRDYIFSDVSISESPDGLNWSQPRTVSADQLYDPTVDIAVSGNSEKWMFTCRTHADSGAATVFFAGSDDIGTTWSTMNPVVLDDLELTGNEYSVALANNGARWLIALPSSHYSADVAGNDSDIFLASSLDDGGNWSEQPFNEEIKRQDVGADLHPGVASAGNDNWIVVWQTNEDLNSSIGSDMDIAFSTAGPGFPSPTPTPTPLPTPIPTPTPPPEPTPTPTPFPTPTPTPTPFPTPTPTPTPIPTPTPTPPPDPEPEPTPDPGPAPSAVGKWEQYK